MGPHHPSTHGVLRFILRTDGEILKTAIPDVGFLHRSIEKIAETLPYPQFFPYTDRVDYLAAMNANHAYAVAVEKLLGIEFDEGLENNTLSGLFMEKLNHVPEENEELKINNYRFIVRKINQNRIEEVEIRKEKN